MINSTVYTIAQASAAALQELTGKRILAAGNSNLSILTGLSYVGNQSNNPEVTYADILQASTQDTVDGPSAHTAALHGAVDALVPLVAGQISFVRNTVLPKVQSFEESMLEAIRRADARNPMESFNVVQVSAPEPASNEDLIELVKSFADDGLGVPSNLSLVSAAGVLDNAAIAAAMEVSSAKVNSSIKNWIAERGDDWLASIWMYYFGGSLATRSSAYRYDGSFAGIRAQAPYQRLDTSLALFLISRGLLDSPPEEVKIDLNVWRATMDHISRYSAAQVMHAIRMLDTTSMKNTVILSVSEDTRTITVNTAQYDPFIEQGGSMDIVVGAALSGRLNSYSYQDLQERGQDYQNIWNSYKASAQSSVEATSTVALRNEAIGAFAATVQPCDEDEAAFMSNTNRTAESMISEVTNIVNGMVLKDLRDAHSLAICLIAGVRFAHTPAKQFITDMDKAQEAGCTCPREAAAQAAINYLCDYAAGQLALGN